MPGRNIPMTRLTSRQRELLQLAVEAGECVNLHSAPYRAAWIVRLGGLTHEFSEATGDRLVVLGLIRRARTNGRGEAVTRRGDYGQRYLPTAAGKARVQRKKSRE